MGTVISLAFDGRRRRQRHRVQPGWAVCYCLVLDKSDNGVQIRTRSDFQAPSEFVIRVGNTDRRYSVVWRKGPVLGAKLVTARPAN